MKNKIAGVVFVLVAIGAVGAAFYFSGQDRPSADSIENSAMPDRTADDRAAGDRGQSEGKLVTDDFEIIVPAGWRSTAPAIGSSATVIKADEQLDDPAAEKINFRSYFAVSYDLAQEKTLSEYTEAVRDQLRQLIPGIVFAGERDLVINGRAARAFEADFVQQGADFKILMVAVGGSGDDVWVVSFNTLQSLWDEYRETISEIAESFKLKLRE